MEFAVDSSRYVLQSPHPLSVHVLLDLQPVEYVVRPPNSSSCATSPKSGGSKAPSPHPNPSVLPFQSFSVTVKRRTMQSPFPSDSVDSPPKPTQSSSVAFPTRSLPPNQIILQTREVRYAFCAPAGLVPFRVPSISLQVVQICLCKAALGSSSKLPRYAKPPPRV